MVLAGPYGGYGNYVRIRNDDDPSFMTAYGHIVNGGILVHVGETVRVGQNIALVGSTGWSTGCHLHFEVYHTAPQSTRCRSCVSTASTSPTDTPRFWSRLRPSSEIKI